MAEMRERLQNLADHNSFLQKQILASRLHHGSHNHRHVRAERSERREKILPTVQETMTGEIEAEPCEKHKQADRLVRAMSIVAALEEDSNSTGSPKNRTAKCSSLLPSAPPSKPVARASTESRPEM